MEVSLPFLNSLTALIQKRSFLWSLVEKAIDCIFPHPKQARPASRKPPETILDQRVGVDMKVQSIFCVPGAVIYGDKRVEEDELVLGEGVVLEKGFLVCKSGEVVRTLLESSGFQSNEVERGVVDDETELSVVVQPLHLVSGRSELELDWVDG